jgi:hypothetical protein
MVASTRKHAIRVPVSWDTPLSVAIITLWIQNDPLPAGASSCVETSWLYTGLKVARLRTA